MVSWAGYPDVSECTWEPEEIVWATAPQRVAEFWGSDAGAEAMRAMRIDRFPTSLVHSDDDDDANYCPARFVQPLGCQEPTPFMGGVL